jgi:hypothetical protein
MALSDHSIRNIKMKGARRSGNVLIGAMATHLLIFYFAYSRIKYIYMLESSIFIAARGVQNTS